MFSYNYVTFKLLQSHSVNVDFEVRVAGWVAGDMAQPPRARIGLTVDPGLNPWMQALAKASHEKVTASLCAQCTCGWSGPL